MTKLDVVGRIDNIASLDMEPVILPMIGYTLDDQSEVIEEFKFRAWVPTAAEFAVVAAMGARGAVPFQLIKDWLVAAVMPDELERWEAFINRSDLIIKKDAIIDAWRALDAYYTARPTVPSSGSSAGQSPVSKTSRGAARVRASRSGPHR